MHQQRVVLPNGGMNTQRPRAEKNHDSAPQTSTHARTHTRTPRTKPSKAIAFDTPSLSIHPLVALVNTKSNSDNALPTPRDCRRCSAPKKIHEVAQLRGRQPPSRWQPRAWQQQQQQRGCPKRHLKADSTSVDPPLPDTICDDHYP